MVNDDWYEKLKERDASRDKKKRMCGDAPAPLSTYKERTEHEADKVSKEKQQEVLDLLHTRGMSIGMVCKKAGLETSVVCEIIKRNTLTRSWLSDKVVENETD